VKNDGALAEMSYKNLLDAIRKQSSEPKAAPEGAATPGKAK
jgi:hypothetical protein